TADLGNTGDGVLLENASGNTVGGLTTTPGTGLGNVISGNDANGVHILDSGGTADSNVVWGNLIGTDVHGTVGLGNTGDGVLIEDASTSGNVVVGNLIATDAAGTAALGNSSDGVFIGFGAAANIVGGLAAGARNVISGNRADGVGFQSAGTSGNLVAG